MSVDDVLRDALRDDRYALRAWPDATARVRAGMSRRRRRRAAIAAAVVTAVAALATPAAIRLSSYPTTLSVGPTVAVTPSPGQVIPWREQPVASASFGPKGQGLVAAGIDVASSVDPGSDLPYIVVLENRSDRELPLDPCPAFVQHLGPDGGTYLLNCVVRMVPAHSWIRLQMQLRVSATAPAGLENLSWAIDVDGQVASAIANVTVR